MLRKVSTWIASSAAAVVPLLMIAAANDQLGLYDAAAPHYSERRVAEGAAFSLSCRLPPGAPAVTWLKDGRQLASGAGYELHAVYDDNDTRSGTRVQTLSVPRAQLVHSGEYSCANSTPPRYHHVLVVPTEKRALPQTAADCLTLRDNETLEIPCALPAGRDVTAVRWFRDGHALRTATDRRLRVRRDGALVVAAASQADVGEYRCRSDADEAPAVVVATPVQLQVVPASLTVDAGAAVNIACKVLGAPTGSRPRSVSWLVGGEPLASSSGSRARLSSLDGVANSLLTLAKAAPADSALYTCRLDERCYRAAPAASTSVHVWPHGLRTNEPLPGAGLLIRPYDPELMLSCSQPDDSESTFDWSKDGVSLTAGDRVSVAGTTLTVQRPQEDDAGHYECRLRGSNLTVSIQVRYKVHCYMDWEGSDPEPSYWIRGQRARLAVRLSGWPPARIVWLRDGLVLSPSERVRLEAHRNVSKAALVVSDVADADRGNYSCLASNGFDADRLDVMVRIRYRYSFLVPLSGIAVEVVVLLAIIAVSELRRRRAKVRADRQRARGAAPSASAAGDRRD
ncbi:protein sax-3-like [Amblyomma americanum]